MNSRNTSTEVEELRTELEILREENNRARDENRRLKARAEAIQNRLATGAGPAGPEPAHGPWLSGQRIGIFVDVQNLYYTAKNVFQSKLHYRKLLEHVVRGRQLVRAIAYVVEKEGADQQGFYDALRYSGYEIRARALPERPEGSRKGDWDMGIAIDCLTMASRLDTVILVTGDGDFEELVEALDSRGVRVEVACFPESTADRLRDSAHEFLALDESHLVD